jgi:hypothetical protein
MAGTQAQADHAKWLGTLRAWVPTEPSEVLVALIDSLVEASGPARIEALDALIARTDGTTRSGREKFERLRRWSDKIRAEHPFWPQRIERPRAVSSLIKAILDKASYALDRSEVERKYRKVRPVPPSGLSQELKEMAKRGEIDRHAAGLYWRKGTAAKPYESQTQQLYRLVHDAPGHRMPNAELAHAMDLGRKHLETLLSHTRKRWCDPPLFKEPTGAGVTVVSAKSLAVLKRDGRIADGRGGTFFSAPKAVMRAEAVTFRTLRPERQHVDSPPSARLGATRSRQAAEKECEQRLIERHEAYVRDGRKERPLKEELKAEMTQLIPKLSGHGFDRAWKATAVAKNWDWADPGFRGQRKPPQKPPPKDPPEK